MREEFENLVNLGKITAGEVDQLVALAEAGFCMHRGWGFGRITTVDTVLSRFAIDFKDKPGHTMDLSFAAKSLLPIDKDHVQARKATDLAGLQQMAATQHLELIKVVLKSYDGRATAAQIQEALVPEIISDDWKKWWDTVRKEMKKDGHFEMPVKKTAPIVYHDEEVTLDDKLMTELNDARGLKAKILVVSEISKNLEELGNAKGLGERALELLNEDIISHQKNKPALTLEAIFERDELAKALGMQVSDVQIKDHDVWQAGNSLATIIDEMPSARQKKTLSSYKKFDPEGWEQATLDVINNAQAKLVGDCASLLIKSDRLEVLKSALAGLINQHQASTELLLWLAKNRSDSFADILGPEVFRAMMTAIERDQFNEKKSSKLPDYILGDKDLIPELISSADIEVIKDLTRALKMSTCFEDMDKRSLLARVVKQYPAVQSLISGDTQKEDATLVVSWASLRRREKEYDRLVHKKMPENRKEIAIARSYGDLRENHEYKAAKEMQRILEEQKATLETDLSRAQGADFKNPDTSAVNLGTLVKATDLATNQLEEYIILGAWDSEPEKNIISYQTPIAKCMLGRTNGDEVEFEVGGLSRKLRIESIQAWEGKLEEPVEELEVETSDAEEATSA